MSEGFLATCARQWRYFLADSAEYWRRRDGGMAHGVLYAITCHGWHVVALFRLAKVIHEIRMPVLSHVLKLGLHLVWFVAKTWYGISINPSSEIGPGFYIGHFGGIFVRGQIGANCSIAQGVTLGSKGAGRSQGWPILGDHVYVGAGAKIIGAVRVGDHAVIGANAVVVSDVPPGALAVGVPARIRARLVQSQPLPPIADQLER